MGLMDKLGSPEFAMYLASTGGALSSAGRGQGFNMQPGNAALMSMMQNMHRAQVNGSTTA